jgi:hypothetical protein
MLSFHNVEDIHVVAKGVLPGGNYWVELEIITQESISFVTLYPRENSNLLRKLERLFELIVDDWQTRPEDSPFDIQEDRTPMPRVARGPNEVLLDEYLAWSHQQGFADSMPFEERINDDLTEEQRIWLTHFMLRWELRNKGE